MRSFITSAFFQRFLGGFAMGAIALLALQPAIV
jgi:hypothetical protein